MFEKIPPALKNGGGDGSELILVQLGNCGLQNSKKAPKVLTPLCIIYILYNTLSLNLSKIDEYDGT